jgi:hypothetical protein
VKTVKINLADLAKESDSAYLDVQCSFGTIRVYHVPDSQLLSAGRLDKSEPELPQVRMKTADGRYQNRNAKKGDREFEVYQAELAEYWNEATEMRSATALVLALKDIDWSEYDLSKPPPAKQAQEIYNGNWPKSKTLQKYNWLTYSVMFKRVDSEAIFAAIRDLRGDNEPDENMVDEVKKNLV